ncbi:hypothetical protein PFISCL1PPCAC_25081, partial [Pristionchus fissidentatus]
LALLFLHIFASFELAHAKVTVIKPEDIYALYDSNLISFGGSILWTCLAVVFVLFLFGTIFFFNRFMQHELTEYAVLQPAPNENKETTKELKVTKKDETKKEDPKDAKDAKDAKDSKDAKDAKDIKDAKDVATNPNSTSTKPPAPVVIP